MRSAVILGLVFLIASEFTYAKSPEPYNQDKKFRRASWDRPRPEVRALKPTPRYEPSKPSVPFEFHTGMNFSYGSATPSKPGATRNGVSLEVTYDLPLSETFSFTPGIGWMQRGVTTSILDTSFIDVTGEVKLEYIEFPLFLKGKFFTGSPRLSFFALGGPAVAIAIKREVKVMNLLDLDLKDRFAPMDLTLNLGGGVQYLITRNFGITGQVRCTYGIIDIDKTDTKFFTRGIQLLVGLAFGF